MNFMNVALEATPVTMSSLVTEIGTFFTGLLGWFSDFIAFVAGEPVLMIFVVLALAITVINLCRSWLPGNGM